MAKRTDDDDDGRARYLAASRDWRPVPDPTKLTTDAVNAVTDQYRRDMHSHRELLETRLEAMDKATELLAATLNHVPTETDKAVNALRDLLGARIDGMDVATKLLADQVAEVPTATDKAINALKAILLGEITNVRSTSLEKFTAIEGTFASNALALTAALAAQKEAAAEQNKSNTLAITKSEQATKETIAANAAQTTNSLASLAATVADLKDRLVRLEAGGLATRESRAEAREVRGGYVAENGNKLVMLGIAITVVVIIVNVVIAVIIHH
jgi:septal ring factor EnvC (AmiA/AmiB activator)